MSGEHYEIRFLNADGTLSLLFITCCDSDDDAHATALRKFAAEMKPFEIRQGTRLVAKGPQAR